MLQRLYLIPFFALIIGACARVTYAPTQQVTPLLREKGDMRFSLSYEDLQYVYALTDRWALTFTGQLTTRWLQNLPHNNEYYKNEIFPDTNNTRLHGFDIDYETRGGQVELGIGYAIPFGQPTGPHRRMEFFAGYSYGHYRTMDSNLTPHRLSPWRKSDFWISNRFHRIFGQTNFALVGKKADMVFSSRLSLVNFHGLYSNGWSWYRKPGNRARFHDLEGKLIPIFEPAVTFTAGPGRLQSFCQIRGAFHPLYGIGDDAPSKKVHQRSYSLSR